MCKVLIYLGKWLASRRKSERGERTIWNMTNKAERTCNVVKCMQCVAVCQHTGRGSHAVHLFQVILLPDRLARPLLLRLDLCADIVLSLSAFNCDVEFVLEPPDRMASRRRVRRLSRYVMLPMGWLLGSSSRALVCAGVVLQSRFPEVFGFRPGRQFSGLWFLGRPRLTACNTAWVLWLHARTLALSYLTAPPPQVFQGLFGWSPSLSGVATREG